MESMALLGNCSFNCCTLSRAPTSGSEPICWRQQTLTELTVTGCSEYSQAYDKIAQIEPAHLHLYEARQMYICV